MNTDSPLDGSGPSGESDHEAHGTSSSNFVGDGQDGWQAPDTGVFTGVPSHPTPGSATGPWYPGYGSYQTPPADQPGYVDGLVSGSAPYPGAPECPGVPGDPGYSGYGGYTSALAPRLSIIPLRLLSIGEILGGIFESLCVNPKVIFIPSLVVVSIVGLLPAGSFTLFLSRLGLPGLMSERVELPDADLDKVGASLVSLLAQLDMANVLSMMTTSIIIDLLIAAISRTILSHKTSLSDVWQRIRPRVQALIGQMLLIELVLAVITAVITAIAAGIGWALLRSVIINGAAEDSTGTIIPATLAILAVITVLGLAVFAPICKLCLAPTTLVLEDTDVMEGTSRSWTPTWGYFWHIVGIRLFSFIIIFFASQIVSQGISIVIQGLLYATPDMTLAILVISTLLSSFVQAAILPFDPAVVALMYTDPWMHSEGLDVELCHAVGV